MALSNMLKKILKLDTLSWERVMKNTKNLGFDAFAILSFFLVKYNIGSVQNLVTTLWVVEDLSALVPV